jgi:hypothetical protein
MLLGRLSRSGEESREWSSCMETCEGEPPGGVRRVVEMLGGVMTIRSRIFAIAVCLSDPVRFLCCEAVAEEGSLFAPSVSMKPPVSSSIVDLEAALSGDGRNGMAPSTPPASLVISFGILLSILDSDPRIGPATPSLPRAECTFSEPISKQLSHAKRRSISSFHSQPQICRTAKEHGHGSRSATWVQRRFPACGLVARRLAAGVRFSRIRKASPNLPSTARLSSRPSVHDRIAMTLP